MVSFSVEQGQRVPSGMASFLVQEP